MMSEGATWESFGLIRCEHDYIYPTAIRVNLEFRLNICAKHILPMPVKTNINDCCSHLQAAMESPWDTYLVQLVRIQEIYNASNSMLDGSSDNECQTSQRFFMETSQVERQVQELGTTLRQESPLQGMTTRHTLILTRNLTSNSAPSDVFSHATSVCVQIRRRQTTPPNI